MGRRYDPDRRQRIIDAAIRVVSDRGIDGLSHRSVAAEADVPLGSTTYHFATLDDLLVAALRKVCLEPQTALDDWRRHLGREGPLADRLAGLLDEVMAGDRSRIRVEYELYLAALRRAALQPVAAEWLDSAVGILSGYTADPATARALIALMDGLLLQLLLTGRPFDRAEAREALARVIGCRTA
ncbi:TetR/AcrR family transcriptional regulator [Streptomyces sp. 7N604]|uniref:TetR/AcrR family transcriptional regulator n=1 Tax=Streptomyces sp. 7N604 TaxID=3457415 RepID=UPI003FD45373